MKKRTDHVSVLLSPRWLAIAYDSRFNELKRYRNKKALSNFRKNKIPIFVHL